MSETEDVNPHAEPKKKCDGLRYDLKMCLMRSECVQTYHHLPKVIRLISSFFFNKDSSFVYK